MQVSRRVDYGIRAMIDIASRSSNGVIATRDVAERQEIPQVFLTKIITRLMRAGLLHTHRGAAGGVYLARPPDEINMLDIIRAVEGPIAINRCTREPSDCRRDSNCASKQVWQKMQTDMIVALQEARLSDLAARNDDLLCNNGVNPS